MQSRIEKKVMPNIDEIQNPGKTLAHHGCKTRQSSIPAKPAIKHAKAFAPCCRPITPASMYHSRMANVTTPSITRWR
jgi:hypothetical protein